MRAAERLDQDLTLVDGINIDRDVVVIVCARTLQRTFKVQLGRGESVLIQVRAWHKPQDGGWREMRLNEPSVEQAERYANAGTTEPNWRIEERKIRVTGNTAVDPVIVVPLRRDAVKADDLVRILVTVAPECGDAQECETAPENQQVIDSTFRVGRFGLHIRISDLAVFVQRLGEDRANARGTGPVIFDQVNFRPAPGISYGFNYYHRRRALFRFLEPGFGAHLVFMNWNERLRNPASADADSTQVTSLQIGLGGMVSMFDGTVVAVSGWNLQVKDERSYFGVGFSITGLAQKLSQGLR